MGVEAEASWEEELSGRTLRLDEGSSPEAQETLRSSVAGGPV